MQKQLPTLTDFKKLAKEQKSNNPQKFKTLGNSLDALAVSFDYKDWNHIRPQLEIKNLGINIDNLNDGGFKNEQALRIITCIAVGNSLTTSELESFIAWIDKISILTPTELIDNSLSVFVDMISESNGVHLLGQFCADVFIDNLEKILIAIEKDPKELELIKLSYGKQNMIEDLPLEGYPLNIGMNYSDLKNLSLSKLINEKIISLVYGESFEDDLTAKQIEKYKNIKEKALRYVENYSKPEEDYLMFKK